MTDIVAKGTLCDIKLYGFELCVYISIFYLYIGKNVSFGNTTITLLCAVVAIIMMPFASCITLIKVSQFNSDHIGSL